MRLSELVPLVTVPGIPAQGEPPSILPHARLAWAGKAYVAVPKYQTQLQLFDMDKAGVSAPFGLSVDDLLADDWIIVDPKEAGWT